MTSVQFPAFPQAAAPLLQAVDDVPPLGIETDKPDLQIAHTTRLLSSPLLSSPSIDRRHSNTEPCLSSSAGLSNVTTLRDLGSAAIDLCSWYKIEKSLGSVNTPYDLLTLPKDLVDCGEFKNASKTTSSL